MRIRSYKTALSVGVVSMTLMSLVFPIPSNSASPGKLETTFDASTETLSWKAPTGVPSSEITDYVAELYWPQQTVDNRKDLTTTGTSLSTKGWNYKGLFICVRARLKSEATKCDSYTAMDIPLWPVGKIPLTPKNAHFQYGWTGISWTYHPLAVANNLIEKVEVSIYWSDEFKKASNQSGQNCQIQSIKTTLSVVAAGSSRIIDVPKDACDSLLNNPLVTTTLVNQESEWNFPQLPDGKPYEDGPLPDYGVVVKVISRTGTSVQYQSFFRKIPLKSPKLIKEVESNLFSSTSKSPHTIAIGQDGLYLEVKQPYTPNAFPPSTLSPLNIKILTPETCKVNPNMVYVTPKKLGADPYTAFIKGLRKGLCTAVVTSEANSIFAALPEETLNITVVAGRTVTCSDGRRSFKVVLNTKNEPVCSKPYKIVKG